MDLSVIIPTLRVNQPMLDKAIFSVRWTAPDAEIIVIQDGSFAENCNAGARVASNETLVFLNDDTEVQPGWWQPLVAALEAGHHVAGSRLIYSDGRLQHAGIYFTVDNGWLMGHNHTSPQPSGPVDAVTGACLAIRHTDFDTLDGFDTGYINGNEDVDLCFRVRAHGGSVWYCADSTVIHHESQSGPARWSHVSDNVRRLTERWQPHVERTDA